MRGKDRQATPRSRRLRRDATDAERRLWNCLRDRRLGGFKFVRQEPIGPYVADFCCRETRLVVEIDGGQHADSKRDRTRDAWLLGRGYRVMRFWNNDVLENSDGVLEAMLELLRTAPHPDPLPVNGEREKRT